MGIQGRSWKHGRACEQIVELPGGRMYTCGKFTKNKDARCAEHHQQRRESNQRGPDQRRAS